MNEAKSLAAWATPSKIFAIVGGAVCIVGGIGLAGLKARGADSMIEAIANGIGYYFIGKGIFMISMVSQFRAAIHKLVGKQDE